MITYSLVTDLYMVGFAMVTTFAAVIMYAPDETVELIKKAYKKIFKKGVTA